MTAFFIISAKESYVFRAAFLKHPWVTDTYYILIEVMDRLTEVFYTNCYFQLKYFVAL